MIDQIRKMLKTHFWNIYASPLKIRLVAVEINNLYLDKRTERIFCRSTILKEAIGALSKSIDTSGETRDEYILQVSKHLHSLVQMEDEVGAV